MGRAGVTVATRGADHGHPLLPSGYIPESGTPGADADPTARCASSECTPGTTAASLLPPIAIDRGERDPTLISRGQRASRGWIAVERA
jgi:hypothetical protein